jgi:hypothetical protein
MGCGVVLTKNIKQVCLRRGAHCSKLFFIVVSVKGCRRLNSRFKLRIWGSHWVTKITTIHYISLCLFPLVYRSRLLGELLLLILLLRRYILSLWRIVLLLLLRGLDVTCLFLLRPLIWILRR